MNRKYPLKTKLVSNFKATDTIKLYKFSTASKVDNFIFYPYFAIHCGG